MSAHVRCWTQCTCHCSCMHAQLPDRSCLSMLTKRRTLQGPECSMRRSSVPAVAMSSFGPGHSWLTGDGRSCSSAAGDRAPREPAADRAASAAGHAAGHLVLPDCPDPVQECAPRLAHPSAEKLTVPKCLPSSFWAGLVSRMSSELENAQCGHELQQDWHAVMCGLSASFLG